MSEKIKSVIDSKTWGGIKRQTSKICSAISGKNLKVLDVEAYHADAVAYTSERETIHANPNHSLYDGLTLPEHQAALIGVIMHELMHQMLTNFVLFKKTIKSMDKYEMQIFGQLHNILEDARIEHYAYQFIGGYYLQSLKFIIKHTWETTPDIDEAGTAFGQLMSAMVQFGDLGQVKGHFTHLKAKEAFMKLAPLFDKYIYETNDNRCMKLCKEIFEITRSVWEEEIDKAKAMEEMMKMLSEAGKSPSGGSGKGGSSAEDDSDEEGDSTSKRRKASISEIAEQIKNGGSAGGKGGKGSKLEYDPKTAEEAQEAADVAKNCANEAAESAKNAAETAKADPTDSKKKRDAERAASAAEKAEKAAQEAQEAADRAKSAKEAGDAESEEANAKAAGKAAMRASAAAKAASDAESGNTGSSGASIAETAEDAEAAANDAGEAAKEAEEAAKEAEKKASEAASGSSEGSGESGEGSDGESSGTSEAEKAAKNAERARKAAERAAKAASEAKAHAEAAKAAKEAGDAEGEAREAKAAERAAKRAEAAAKAASDAQNGLDDGDEAEDATGGGGSESDSDNTSSEVTDRTKHGGRPDYAKADAETEGMDEGTDNDFATEFDSEDYELSESDLAAIEAEVERCMRENEMEKMEDTDEIDLLNVDIKSPRFKKAHTCLNRRISVGDPGYASELYSKLLSKLSPGISSLTAQLRRIFRNDQEEVSHRASGQLNQKRLNSGRKTIRVFDKKNSPAQKSNLSVLLLIDESGSMSGSRAEAAKQCAISLAETLNNCKVPCYIIGFTADTSGSDAVHNHYISWRNSKSDRLRLLDITARANNFDGYSIRYAGEVLKKHNSEHKLMIVISDGQPACSAYWGTDGIADTKDAIREVRKYASVLGVAIGNSDTEELHYMYGKDFIHISRVDELFTGISKKISRIVREWE